MNCFFAHWPALTLGAPPACLTSRSPPSPPDGWALVLGFVNAVVRPLLLLLTLPITLVTLGLFYLVINGSAFRLVTWLVPGLDV